MALQIPHRRCRQSKKEFEAVDAHKPICSESYEAIRAPVQAARNILQQRFTGNGLEIVSNVDMHMGEIRQFCKLQEGGQSLMRAAMDAAQFVGACLSSYSKASAHL